MTPADPQISRNERLRALEALREREERYALVVAGAEAAIWDWDVLRKRVDFSPRWKEIRGLGDEEVSDSEEEWSRRIHPADAERVMAAVRAHFEGRTPVFAEEYRVRHKDGYWIWILDRGLAKRDADGRVIRMAGSETEITDRKRAETANAVLAAAGRELSASLDYQRTLASVARVTVPDFADWCAIDMLDESGALRRLAVAHVDPVKIALAQDLHEKYPAGSGAAYGAGHVVRTGSPEMMSEVPETLIETAARDEEHLRILRSLGLKSYMCVPLIAHDKTLGAITFVSAESQWKYDPHDLAVAQEIARRASEAIENARLYRDLRESEERFRDIFDTAGVSVWVEDFTEVKAAIDDLQAGGVRDLGAYLARHPEFVRKAIRLVRVVDVNEETLALFGAESKPELLGSLGTVFTPESENVFVEELIALAEGRRSLKLETPLRTLDGRPVSVLLTIHFGISDHSRVVVTLTDITLRKQAERTLQEQAEIVETINRTGRLLSAELELEKLAQAVTDAATELAGARFGSFFYNVYSDSGGAYMLHTLSGAPREAFAHFPMPRATDLFGPTFRGEATIRIDDVKKDPRYGKSSPYHGMPPGHLPVTSYLAVPVVSRSGEVLGGLFFAHPDAGVFTERAARIVEGLAAQAAIAIDNARLYQMAQHALRDREELLASEQEARKQAEEASRMKDEFLATVSHELRTPLSAVLGWAHMLRAGRVDTDKVAAALEIIERNARAQNQLIDDLLDVSRIITGKLRLDVRPIDPALPIDAAIEALRPAAEAKGVHVRKVIDTGGGAISGDADRLQQIVWNLLSNAIKFTPRGGRVQIRLQRVDSHIEIVVTDTGVGIKPDFVRFIFDRFRQADATTTRAHGGLGLGLSIVRHLVELHGGEVHVASGGEGAGATFTVKLPILAVYGRQGGKERAHPRASAAWPEIESSHRLDGLKVLVVDDEPDACDLLRAMLKGCGADATVVTSADLALDALQHSRFDLIVSDIGMPEIDGYEMMRTIRSLPAESGGRTPAIALTAYARTEDRLRALRAGYQMHVPKPIEYVELVTVMASLAGRHDRMSE